MCQECTELRARVEAVLTSERFTYSDQYSPAQISVAARTALRAALAGSKDGERPVPLCDGCNVREPHEHRCHGLPCPCEECREADRLFGGPGLVAPEGHDFTCQGCAFCTRPAEPATEGDARD